MCGRARERGHPGAGGGARAHTHTHTHARTHTFAQFLQSEPVIVTSGADNALRMWVLDDADCSARLLRQRDGHAAPPTRIRYVAGGVVASIADGSDASVCQILSVGEVGALVW